MSYFSQYPGAVALLAGIIASLSAQAYKVIYHFIKYRRIDLSKLVLSGGMPSSHSALMSCLTTCVGLADGFYSTTFAIALTLTFIVMYDASGVRRSVGVQARILNQMITEFNDGGRTQPMNRIKELLGHTPLEVISGAIFGVLVGLLAYWLGS